MFTTVNTVYYLVCASASRAKVSGGSWRGRIVTYAVECSYDFSSQFTAPESGALPLYWCSRNISNALFLVNDSI
jgi:hypothetical protein